MIYLWDTFRAAAMALAVAVAAMTARLAVERVRELRTSSHDDTASLLAIDAAFFGAAVQAFLLSYLRIGHPPRLYGAILSIPWLSLALGGLIARRRLIATRRQRRSDDA